MASSFFPRIPISHGDMGAFMVYLSQQEKSKIEILKKGEFNKLEPYLSQLREVVPEFLGPQSRVRKVLFLEMTVTPGEYRRLINNITDGDVEPDSSITTYQFPISLSPSLVWYVVLHSKRTMLHLSEKRPKKFDPIAEKRKLEVALKMALAEEDYRAAAKLQQELRANYGQSGVGGAEKGKKSR